MTSQPTSCGVMTSPGPTSGVETEGKLNEPSVESPYTSLGSDGSYNGCFISSSNNRTTNPTADFTTATAMHTTVGGTGSLNNTWYTRSRSSNHTARAGGVSYLSLCAKAEQGHAKYESRTKAVMDALQGLQNKIRRIEADRSTAEINLKCLALETKDYAELLKLKENLGGNMDTMLKDSQSKELESQLQHAQDRCNVLEKQLEGMRKVMKSPPEGANVAATLRTTNNVTAAAESPTPTNNDTDKTIVPSPKSANNGSFLPDTSALEKLIGLEKEHKKLTMMQTKTEDKITKLEEKIRKEAQHRKQLQDKTKQLQTVINSPKDNSQEVKVQGGNQQQQRQQQQQQHQRQQRQQQQQRDGTKSRRRKKVSQNSVDDSKSSRNREHH